MIEQLNASLDLIIAQTKTHVTSLEIILLIPWLMLLLSYLTGKRLLLLGIIPRRIIGLPGVLLAPLLHADFNHLFFNSIPLLVLSNFLLFHGLYYFVFVTIAITVLSGLLIWCFAKPGIHIGASAVITGYWALLVGNSYREGTVTAIILGVICVYYFAGIFLGIFPSKKGVSWEGHLFGLLSGGIVCYLLMS